MSGLRGGELERDPKQNHKNRPKDENGRGWCIDDLYFDEEGCIYVANKDLAEAIQSSLDAWHGHLTIYRDPRPGEKPTPIATARAVPALERPGELLQAMLKTGSPRDADADGGARPTAKTMETADSTTTTTEYSGPKVNMMCPCAPEP